MKPGTRKRCPNCGNINIGLWVGAAAGVLYRCNNCGYHGPIVVEEDIGGPTAKKGKAD